jgi:hypothetical protein
VRLFVLLLALSATLLVSTVAASPAHFHNNDFTGGCDICSIAHLPAVQPALAVEIFAPALTYFRVPPNSIAHPSDPVHSSALSRGPPASVVFSA